MCVAGNRLRVTKQLNYSDFKILQRENVPIKMLSFVRGIREKCMVFKITTNFLSKL